MRVALFVLALTWPLAARARSLQLVEVRADVATGSAEVITTPTLPPATITFPPSPPATRHAALALRNNDLVRVASDGHVVWRTRLGGWVDVVIPVAHPTERYVLAEQPTLLPDEGDLVLVLVDRTLVRLDPNSGRIRWRQRGDQRTEQPFCKLEPRAVLVEGARVYASAVAKSTTDYGCIVRLRVHDLATGKPTRTITLFDRRDFTDRVGLQLRAPHDDRIEATLTFLVLD